jgi:hypothetical protein
MIATTGATSTTSTTTTEPRKIFEPKMRKRKSLCEPADAGERKYPTTLMSMQTREVITRIVLAMEELGIEPAVIDAVLENADCAVPKSTMNRYKRNSAGSGEIFAREIASGRPPLLDEHQCTVARLRDSRKFRRRAGDA